MSDFNLFYGTIKFQFGNQITNSNIKIRDYGHTIVGFFQFQQNVFNIYMKPNGETIFGSIWSNIEDSKFFKLEGLIIGQQIIGTIFSEKYSQITHGSFFCNLIKAIQFDYQPMDESI